MTHSKIDTGKKFPQQIELSEMSHELARELATRKRVYPRWIADGKIKQDIADFRCLVLEAILRKIRAEETAHKPQKELFQ